MSRALPKSDCSTETSKSLFIYFEPSMSTWRTAMIGEAKTMSTNTKTAKKAEPVTKYLDRFRTNLFTSVSVSTSCAKSSMMMNFSEVGAMFTVALRASIGKVLSVGNLNSSSTITIRLGSSTFNAAVSNFGVSTTVSISESRKLVESLTIGSSLSSSSYSTTCTSGFGTLKILIGVALPSNASFSSASTSSESFSERTGTGSDASGLDDTPKAASNWEFKFDGFRYCAPASALTAVVKPTKRISLRSSMPCASLTRWRTNVINSTTSSALPSSSD